MLYIRKVLILFIILAVVCGRSASADDEEQAALKVLTLDDCVKAALANNPKLQETASKVDLSKANAGIAKSDYLPQASTTGGYTHYDTSKIAFQSLAITGPDKRYSVLSETTGVSQLIWDFGKTLNRIKAANETLSASQYEFLEAQEGTILNAEKGYFNVMRSQLFVDAAIQDLEMTKSHLERAKGFYEVGYQQPYDVTKAELSVANAEFDLITAKKNFGLAKASLNNIMGNTGGAGYRVEEAADFISAEVDLEEALQAASKNRVELMKLQAKARAAQANLAEKQKGNWPAVSVGGNHQVSDTDTPGVGNVRNWNVGAQVSWPWFNGFRTKSDIEAAQANLKMSQLAIQDETLTIGLEVQNAVLSLQEAKERINASKKLLQQSSENLEITNARYEEGLGSIIEVTDAETSLVSAKKTHAAAIADYLSSLADYQKSIGVISQGVVK